MKSKILIGLILIIVVSIMIGWPQSNQQDPDTNIIDGNGSIAEYHEPSSSKPGNESPSSTGTATKIVSNNPVSSTSYVLEDYRKSTNLLEFIQRWEAESNSNPSATRAVASAFEECQAIGAIGSAKYFSSFSKLSDTIDKGKPEAVAARQSALQRLAKRCEPLIVTRSNLREASQKLFAQAALQGDALARARLLAEKTVSGEIDKVALATSIMEILSSGDPEAIMTLGDLNPEALAQLFHRDSVAHRFLNSPFATWLAACNLGFDCSATSPILNSYCLAQGPCGYGSVEQFLRFNMVSIGQYNASEIAARQTTDALRLGNVSQLTVIKKGD